MRREQRAARTLRDLSRRATQARVDVRRLTTRQAAVGEDVLNAVTSDGAASGTALTMSDEGGTTVKYFMVGKDGFGLGESWVLG